jgi:hypothetical protein
MTCTYCGGSGVTETELYEGLVNCPVCKGSTMKEDLQTILDCMTGVDGGVSFVLLKSLLERCQERNEEADRQILQVVNRMARLIRAVNKDTDH